MKHIFPLLLFSLLLSTCGDDEMPVDPYTQELRINMVTGLQARDVNAELIIAYGNPNTFPGEVNFYPNPTINEANIQYFGGSGLEIKQYWIFPADRSTDFSDIDYNLLLDNETYAPDDIFVLSTVFTDQVNTPAFALNLDQLTTGYYRIFYLMSDDTLYWDNIYVDPGASDLGTLLNRVSDDF